VHEHVVFTPSELIGGMTAENFREIVAQSRYCDKGAHRQCDFAGVRQNHATGFATGLKKRCDQTDETRQLCGVHVRAVAKMEEPEQREAGENRLIYLFQNFWALQTG
jgi:hypothetical protein